MSNNLTFATFKPDRVPHFVIEHVKFFKFVDCVTLKWQPE